jgi:hypothetical protein
LVCFSMYFYVSLTLRRQEWKEVTSTSGYNFFPLSFLGGIFMDVKLTSNFFAQSALPWLHYLKSFSWLHGVSLGEVL